MKPETEAEEYPDIADEYPDHLEPWFQFIKEIIDEIYVLEPNPSVRRLKLMVLKYCFETVIYMLGESLESEHGPRSQ